MSPATARQGVVNDRGRIGLGGVRRQHFWKEAPPVRPAPTRKGVAAAEGLRSEQIIDLGTKTSGVVKSDVLIAFHNNGLDVTPLPFLVGLDLFDAGLLDDFRTVSEPATVHITM